MSNYGASGRIGITVPSVRGSKHCVQFCKRYYGINGGAYGSNTKKFIKKNKTTQSGVEEKTRTISFSLTSPTRPSSAPPWRLSPAKDNKEAYGDQSKSEIDISVTNEKSLEEVETKEEIDNQQSREEDKANGKSEKTTTMAENGFDNVPYHLDLLQQINDDSVGEVIEEQKSISLEQFVLQNLRKDRLSPADNPILEGWARVLVECFEVALVAEYGVNSVAMMKGLTLSTKDYLVSSGGYITTRHLMGYLHIEELAENAAIAREYALEHMNVSSQKQLFSFMKELVNTWKYINCSGQCETLVMAYAARCEGVVEATMGVICYYTIMLIATLASVKPSLRFKTYHDSRREGTCLQKGVKWSMVHKKIINGETINDWSSINFSMWLSNCCTREKTRIDYHLANREPVLQSIRRKKKRRNRRKYIESKQQTLKRVLVLEGAVWLYELQVKLGKLIQKGMNSLCLVNDLGDRYVSNNSKIKNMVRRYFPTYFKMELVRRLIHVANLEKEWALGQIQMANLEEWGSSIGKGFSIVVKIDNVKHNKAKTSEKCRLATVNGGREVKLTWVGFVDVYESSFAVINGKKKILAWDDSFVDKQLWGTIMRVPMEAQGKRQRRERFSKIIDSTELKFKSLLKVHTISSYSRELIANTKSFDPHLEDKVIFGQRGIDKSSDSEG